MSFSHHWRPSTGNVFGEASCPCPLYDSLPDASPVAAGAKASGIPDSPVAAEGELNLPAVWEAHQSGHAQLPAWLVPRLSNAECFYCGRRFKTVATLQTHLEHTTHDVWACCGRIFPTKA